MQGDITYLCGGIGEGEARFMQAQAGSYDLHLTFASQSGAFLADVKVVIRAADGRALLEVRCDAPMLLVDLPRAGSYRIEADASGFLQTRTVRVTEGGARAGRHVVVSWPETEVARMQSGETTPSSGASHSGASGASTPEAR